MSKRFLYLSDYYVLAYQFQRKVLQKVHQFHPNPNGQHDFIEYLSQDKTPIMLLIDTAQEEYRILSVPHLVGKDRHELLNLKIKRLFEQAFYTYRKVQGREKQGRGDDRVLFTALNSPHFLQPWLTLMATYKVPLLGIASLPLLSQELLRYLPKATYTLLVTHTPQISEHSFYGLRQSFFFKQHLQLSRLIPLTTLAPATYPDYVFTQITKTQRYLESSRLLPATGQEFAVIILTDSNLLGPLQTYLKEKLLGLPVSIFESQKFIRRWGLRQVEETLYLHHLVLSQLSHQWQPRNHYAKPSDRRYFIYHYFRIGIYSVALLLLIGSILMSAMTLKEALKVKQEGLTKFEQTTKQREEIQKLRARIPELPLDILLIRNVVDVGRYLKSAHILPRPALEKLSHVLKNNPNLVVEELKWGIGNSPDTIFSTTSPRVEKQTSANPRRNNPLIKRPLIPLPTETAEEELMEVIRVRGKVYPFVDYQKAFNLFTKFMNELRQQRAGFSEVKEISSPYDSKNSLRGEFGSQQELGVAPFEVEISIKHQYIKPDSPAAIGETADEK